MTWCIRAYCACLCHVWHYLLQRWKIVLGKKKDTKCVSQYINVYFIVGPHNKVTTSAFHKFLASEQKLEVLLPSSGSSLLSSLNSSHAKGSSSPLECKGGAWIDSSCLEHRQSLRLWMASNTSWKASSLSNVECRGARSLWRLLLLRSMASWFVLAIALSPSREMELGHPWNFLSPGCWSCWLFARSLSLSSRISLWSLSYSSSDIMMRLMLAWEGTALRGWVATVEPSLVRPFSTQLCWS